MISAVMDKGLIEAASNPRLKVSIAARLVECLLAFLKGNDPFLSVMLSS